MALELRIAGPGMDFTRRLAPGDPALILGRDPDCSVCLIDPERNISRRHLSVWNEAEDLHFHVLSVVNGVDLPAGEVPPGARGILRIGEVLQLSAFHLTVSIVAGDDAGDAWDKLEREATGAQPAVDPLATVPMDEDPFGDWGFGSTFGPGAPGGALKADALAAAEDLKPFFTGLGLDVSRMPPLTRGELEAIGRMARLAINGLLLASQTATGAQEDLRAEDRTMVGAKDANPLRMDTSTESKLHYLFGGRAASAGFQAPDRSVADIVSDVLAHQEAMAAASREAVGKVLEEFDPERLKERLLPSGKRLFESARAWEAFVKDYDEQRLDLAAWVRQLMDLHFATAYVREFERVKRDTSLRRT